jgi:hypothetical protein
MGFFQEHIKHEHNVFQYLSFVTYIRLKDATEYNGIESYVHKCMSRGDISWLPNQMALSLENDEDEGSETMSEISRLEETMKAEVGKSRAEIREVSQKLELLIAALAPQSQVGGGAVAAAATPRGADATPASPVRA